MLRYMQEYYAAPCFIYRHVSITVTVICSGHESLNESVTTSLCFFINFRHATERRVILTNDVASTKNE